MLKNVKRFAICLGGTWQNGREYFTYPPGIAVQEGSPLNYAKGEGFVVMYRETLEKTFPYPRGSVEALTIFINDEEDGLLLKEIVGL